METRPKEVRRYRTKEGIEPYTEWLKNLRDKTTRARIETRIDRIEEGNLGECNFVGKGVYEIKIDFGPGYRVYFGNEGKNIIILLCGGDKKM